MLAIENGAKMSAWESAGQSDEWYTPKYIFDALDCIFDMDVAHPKHQKTHVPAFETLSAGSLERPWFGFVWMNPPFGGRNGLVPWLDKFFDHRNGIALVPDRTSAPWFQDAARRADAVLFVAPKIKFERPDGSLGRWPGNGTALMARGEQGTRALLRAKSLGWVAIGHSINHFNQNIPRQDLSTNAPEKCLQTGAYHNTARQAVDLENEIGSPSRARTCDNSINSHVPASVKSNRDEIEEWLQGTSLPMGRERNWLPT